MLVVVDMNLLNEFFDHDRYEIFNVNKKSVITLLIVIMLITLIILCTKKDNYYINEFSLVNNEMILLVEKNYVNQIKKNKKIIINDIENNYSINKITPVDDNYMVTIKVSDVINNSKTGKYKILIGKENLFEFILRIIKQ